MRWLYHIVPKGKRPQHNEPFCPESLGVEGFIHGSFQPDVLESARLYFKPNEALEVLKIDPRRLDVEVKIETTPRGPMPHIYGAIAADAIRQVCSLNEVTEQPDNVLGSRIGFVAFEGMTLLDLIGVLDPLSRISSMGFDTSCECEVVLAAPQTVWPLGASVFQLNNAQVRPNLSNFDVLVIPGGMGTRTLLQDRSMLDWLNTWPENRMIGTVCTGSLLLGAMGRLHGRKATTHRSAFETLAHFQAIVTDERLVESRPVVTASGVSCALDLGLYLVSRLIDRGVATQIARQMHLPTGFFDFHSCDTSTTQQ